MFSDSVAPFFCLLAYLLGSIPFGLVMTRLFNAQDPRLAGSKNIGFTNVLRVSGRMPGTLTLIGDISKGWIAGYGAVFFFMDSYWIFIAVLAVVWGHLFPIFLKFHGGKGVATGFGGIMGLNYLVGIIILLVWLTGVVIWKYSSGGALLSFTALPLAAWIITQQLDFLIFSCILSVIVIARHKSNIIRLFNGTERAIWKR